jgi:putative lipase involved disintegration of autophagic bodies
MEKSTYKITTFYLPEENLIFLYGRRYSLSNMDSIKLQKLEDTFEKKINSKTLLLIRLNIQLQQLINENVLTTFKKSTVFFKDTIQSVEKEINNMDYCIIQIQKQKIIASETVVLFDKKTNEKITFDNMFDKKLRTIVKSNKYEFQKKYQKRNFLVKELI